MFLFPTLQFFSKFLPNEQRSEKSYVLHLLSNAYEESIKCFRKMQISKTFITLVSTLRKNYSSNHFFSSTISKHQSICQNVPSIDYMLSTIYETDWTMMHNCFDNLSLFRQIIKTKWQSSIDKLTRRNSM